MRRGRGPNPMHGYTIANPARLLCGGSVVLKRRVLVPQEIEKLRADVNPCGACLGGAERLRAEFDKALASTESHS